MAMNWREITIGFALTGSHCTYAEVMPQVEQLVTLGVNVIPIVSYTLQSTDTRFGSADHWKSTLQTITGHRLIETIVDAEPLGPKKQLDLLVIAPCTGTTLSKLANAITDSPVLMAAKAQMRNQRPIVIGISTNDALGLNAANLAKLLVMKHMYFVPFGQDQPENKPNSLVAKMERLIPSIESAISGKQLQPLLLEY